MSVLTWGLVGESTWSSYVTKVTLNCSISRVLALQTASTVAPVMSLMHGTCAQYQLATAAPCGSVSALPPVCVNAAALAD